MTTEMQPLVQPDNAIHDAEVIEYTPRPTPTGLERHSGVKVDVVEAELVEDAPQQAPHGRESAGVSESGTGMTVGALLLIAQRLDVLHAVSTEEFKQHPAREPLARVTDIAARRAATRRALRFGGNRKAA